jgi:hypothetical protein
VKLKISDKVKNVISTVAPTLGAALGGPLGAMAGNVISAALGDGDVEKILIEQKPETLLALRKAEHEFLIQLENLGVEKERIAMADRVSARDLAKVDMRPQMWLSALFVGGYFMIFLAVASGTLEPAPGQQRTIDMLLGMLATGIPMVMAFWFGSTSGSAVKSAMLANSKPADA